MRTDAINLEEKRLEEVYGMEDYNSIHERHRIFPNVFNGKKINKILDISAGVGIVGKRIREKCEAELVCNDISPKCLEVMQQAGLKTVSFDLDDDRKAYPFPDKHFDAIISLSTIEHLINIDHFIKEIHRILQDKGCFYICAPNYSGLIYLMPFLISGKTFHDPLSQKDRYEFYGHIRYFTFRTLVEYVSSFGFKAVEVYLPLPESSSKYSALKSKSKFKALAFRYSMKTLYTFFSPRWASEPVICFQKGTSNKGQFSTIKKVVL